MLLYKTVRKTNEELYEGNIRSDFRTTRKASVAVVLGDYCLLLQGYWKYGKV